MVFFGWKNALSRSRPSRRRPSSSSRPSRPSSSLSSEDNCLEIGCCCIFGSIAAIVTSLFYGLTCCCCCNMCGTCSCLDESETSDPNPPANEPTIKTEDNKIAKD
ncbi:hypothetical protein CDL15_Pgr020285 [Punica granatum]|uniref:Uncharacterized protein n=1 Tax=Punica granatum TaxID=22663 RepID=A0A218VSJ7_PUNGR|nr:hypothetical protein CDL15_Pgr020285 [Punica granatum]